MDRFLGIFGIVYILSIIACVLAAIWTRDVRWAATAVALAAIMVLLTMLGSNKSSESE